MSGFQWPAPHWNPVEYKVWVDSPGGKETEETRTLPPWNLLTGPLGPGKEHSHTCYMSAQAFTKFYGTVYSDQPLLIELDFSNEPVMMTGELPTDDDLPSLHYDGEGVKHIYDKDDPKKNKTTFLAIIFGSWLRVRVTNTGTKPAEEIRVFVRGSVF